MVILTWEVKYPPIYYFIMDDLIIDDDFLNTITHNNDSIKLENSERIVTKKEYSESIKKRNYKSESKKLTYNRTYTDNLFETIASVNASVGYDGKRKYNSKPEPPMEMDRGRKIKYTPIENTDTTENTNTAEENDTSKIVKDTTKSRRSLESTEENNSYNGNIFQGIINDIEYGINNYLMPILQKYDPETKISQGYVDYVRKRQRIEDLGRNLILDESKRPNKLEKADEQYWGNEEKSNRMISDINAMYIPITDTGMKAYGSSSNIATGIIPQNMGKYSTGNRLERLPEGYNIAAPFPNWIDLNENIKDSNVSLDKKDSDFDFSHFYQGKGRRPSFSGFPSYLVVNDQGNFYSSDTIPYSDKGKITTSFYGKGAGIYHNPDGSINLNNEKLHIADSTGVSDKGYYIFSDMKSPKSVNDRNYPINSLVVTHLPNGKKYNVMFFGRTAAEFDREVKRLHDITGDNNMEFHSFDSRSAKYPFFSNETRTSAFHSPGFPALILKKRYGGKKSLTY